MEGKGELVIDQSVVHCRPIEAGYRRQAPGARRTSTSSLTEPSHCWFAALTPFSKSFAEKIVQLGDCKDLFHCGVDVVLDSTKLNSITVED